MFGGTYGRVRAELARLEHRHGRADAEGARHVAAGRDDAALAAADDHRLVGERRVVALLDRGVEGVAIDMRDRQRVRAPRGATGAASRRPGSARPLPATSAGSRGRSRASGSSRLPSWQGGARCSLRVASRSLGHGEPHAAPPFRARCPRARRTRAAAVRRPPRSRARPARKAGSAAAARIASGRYR